MKKFLAMWLAFLMAFSMVSLAGAEAPPPPPEDEVERAIYYGFVPEALQGDYDSGITMAEYCSMLTPMVEMYDATKLDAWMRLSTLAQRSNDMILREHGMLALFRAALTMGGAELDGSQMEKNEEMRDKIGEDIWDDFTWSYPWFPDWQKVAPPPWDVFQGNYMSTGYTFSFLNLSRVSGQTFYDYDEASNSMRPQDPLTRREAALSVVRLFESTEKGLETWWNLTIGETDTPAAVPDPVPDPAPDPAPDSPVDPGAGPAETSTDGTPQANDTPAVQQELSQALALGLGTDVQGGQLTYQEYFSMLDRLITLVDPALTEVWQLRYPWARELDTPLNRSTGMYLTYCAAETLGSDYCQLANPNWTALNDQMGSDIWGGYQIDTDLFPDNDQCSAYDTNGFNRLVSAYFFSFAQYSRQTGQSLFDYDEASNTMRPEAPFTQREALLAAVRLYHVDSVPPPTEEEAREMEVARALGLLPEGMAMEKYCTADELITLLQNAVERKTGAPMKKRKWGAGFPIPTGDAEIDRAWAARLLYEGYRVMFGLGEDCASDPYVYMPGRDDRNAFSPVDTAWSWSWGVTSDYSQYEAALNDREAGRYKPGKALTAKVYDLITFVMCQQDQTNGARVMELTTDRRFRPLDSLSRKEAVLAVKRLYCSQGDVSAASAKYQELGGTLYTRPEGPMRYDNMRLFEDRFHKGQEGLAAQAALEALLAQALQANPTATFELAALEEPENELERALASAFAPAAPGADGDQIITTKEFCAMLGSILQPYGGATTEKWEKAASVALQSNRQMQRLDAMLAIYQAACVLDMGQMPNGDWLYVNGLPDSLSNFDFDWDFPDFPEWANVSPFTQTMDPVNFVLAAIHFAQGQHSSKSGKPILGSDSSPYYLQPREPLTWKDALIAALRFSESIGEVADEEASLAIAYQANLRKEAILASKTEIVKAEVYTPGETYTGTAYFVSNTGDDKNDGLSPEKAWATIQKVNKAKLKPGDAVFFERGGLWRGQMLTTQKDVTYSAYGQGEKPRFYGSPENGAEESKWSLYYSENGVQIWEYHREMTDTGGIIFNEGEGWANREYGWWNGKGYVQLTAPTQPFTLPQCLDDDLDFVSMIDYSGCRFPIDVPTLNRTGGLYLRCDSGNPGLLYQSIEFETTEIDGWSPLINCAATCVVDNLSVLYWGNRGISHLEESSPPNIIIQNCEVGWGGNCLHSLIEPMPTKEYSMSGDGIYGFYNGGIIRNNYCHDIDGVGITFETVKDRTLVQGSGQYYAQGNLVERCGQGIWLHGFFRMEEGSAVYVENNMVLHTGYGYNHGCLCTEVGISVGELPEEGRFDGVYVRGNLVYLSRNLLFSTFDYPESSLHLKDNRYFFK